MKHTIFILASTIIFCSCNGSKDKNNEQKSENKEDVKNEASIETEVAKEKKQLNKAPTNIEDYYYLLPESYFMCDAVEANDSREFRKKAISKKNIKGGFVIAKPQGFYNLEVALFKNRKENIDVVAAFIQCGAGCMCNATDFLVWDSKSSVWKNVTEKIFPSLSDIEAKAGAIEGIEFRLPEKGTTIKGYDEEGNEVVAILWNGTKFHL